jgi:hypothetical protein
MAVRNRVACMAYIAHMADKSTSSEKQLIT